MSGSPYLIKQHALSQQGFPAGVPGWYGSRINVSSRRPVAPQDPYWRRFFEIYHNICGTPRANFPSLSLRTEQSWVHSDDEANLADELFLKELGNVTRSKSIWRSQKKSDSKDYTIATAALIRLVQDGGGRPAVAQCLVRRGGTMSLSKDPQKQAKQISERHNLITIATKLRQTPLVHYFATISPPERIAAALAISVQNDNVELTKVLLENGASPDSLFHTMPDHFDVLSPAMLEILLQSPTTASQRTRDRWLQSAVSNGKMDLAIMLLRYGASSSFDYLGALRTAIDKVHLEAFIIALKCMHSSGAMYFNGLLQQIAQSPGLSFADKMLTTEATLCVANSKEASSFRQRLQVTFQLEQDASETLDFCASSGQIGLVELLREPRFNTKVSAKTLLSAIKACDLHLFDHLYPQNSPNIPPEGLLLAVLPVIEDSQTRERLLLRLLKIQIQGTYLDTELVHAIRNQDLVLVRLLLNAGASTEYNRGQALAAAVEARHVPLVQELLPYSKESTRNTIFPRLQAAEKLSRRLMTQLFVESGLSRDVLNTALQHSVCECTALRDGAVIDILVKSGADYRLVEASSVHGLIDLGDVPSIADLLKRMTCSKTSSRTMSMLASNLMGYLMQCPTERHDERVRFEMIKLFLKHDATGEFVLSAFQSFISSESVADEDLLCIFLSPAYCNRKAPYNTFAAHVLSSIDVSILYRLISKIKLYDDVIKLILEGTALKALDDDAGTADRLRCFLTQVEQDEPALEEGFDFHMRTYAKQCPSLHEWPLQTIDVLISKGFTGTIWLTHALMAVAEAGNAKVLSMVLNSAQQTCSKDTIDSVLMLVVQLKPNCDLRIPEILLNFGASQAGLNMALVIAAETDNAEVCTMLLQHGADVNYRSGESLTSALKQNRQVTLERLLAPGNTNQSSLAGAWTALTSASCNLAAYRKVDFCRLLLQAKFAGAQVQEFLVFCVASPSPDYEMIRTILDESDIVMQDELRLAPTSEEPPVLFRLLSCATGNADERLCRLVLSYLPTSFSIPKSLLMKATITSTAVLDLLLKHIPITDRQEVLDICLVHAVSLAANCGTCTYLLYEGASCEALDYGAISAATGRALLRNNSNRAPLEALLSSSPSQTALRSACYIAIDFLEDDSKRANGDFGQLRTIKVLQIVLSAGLQDLEVLVACLQSLCNQPRTQATKCKECVRDMSAAANVSNISDCCPFQRTQMKTQELMQFLLKLGVIADHDNGQSIVAATRRFQHEMLEILLSSIHNVATSIPQWFVDRNDCEIFFQNSSRCEKQKQARLETMRTLLKYGASFPALECALVTAIHESLANDEAREVAEMLTEFNICDTTGACLQFLVEHPQPALRPLLSFALDREPSKDLRLRAIEILIVSELDDESVSSLVLSGFCGSSSQLLEMTVEETQRVLRATADAGKAETLTLILSCIPEKAILSPFYDSSCFVAWLLKSYPNLTECFLTAVLEWLGPEEIQKIDDGGDGLCLVQEAVLNRRFDLVPLLVSFGAATTTKAVKSLLFDTLEKINGESPEVLNALRSLCNESTLNDGSLHTAVINMHEAVVNLLLDHGHDANFGIPLHESSTEKSFPLNMLCATAFVPAHESDRGLAFKRIATNLMMHGARMDTKMFGRSPLFNALDNSRCTVGLMRNLMDCFQFSEQLDESRIDANQLLGVQNSPGASSSHLSGSTKDTQDTQSFKTARSTPSISENRNRSSFFEFEDEKHHYSASMYLAREVPCPPFFKQPRFSVEKKVALLEFLRTQDLPEIFYAFEGPQPDGAVGVPIEILLSSAECAVCGETVTHIDDAFGNLTKDCMHDWTVFMCKDCLDGYMTSKITVENGAVNSKIPCWAEGCSNFLNHNEIKKYAAPELFELYDHALVQQIIHEGETFAECSTQECKGGGWLESEDVSYFECHLCHQETCVSHNGPLKDHAGKPCPATPEGQRFAEEEAREEAERQAVIMAKTKVEKEAKRKAKAEADRLAKEKKEGLKATEALMKKISKNCPNCKVPIEKSLGCDHMTCRSGSGKAGCGSEFCWECLVPYTAIRNEGNGAHKETCPHYRRNTYLH